MWFIWLLAYPPCNHADGLVSISLIRERVSAGWRIQYARDIGSKTATCFLIQGDRQPPNVMIEAKISPRYEVQNNAAAATMPRLRKNARSVTSLVPMA
jgi:hypothetical protein